MHMACVIIIQHVKSLRDLRGGIDLSKFGEIASAIRTMQATIAFTGPWISDINRFKIAWLEVIPSILIYSAYMISYQLRSGSSPGSDYWLYMISFNWSLYQSPMGLASSIRGCRDTSYPSQKNKPQGNFALKLVFEVLWNNQSKFSQKVIFAISSLTSTSCHFPWQNAKKSRAKRGIFFSAILELVKMMWLKSTLQIKTHIHSTCVWLQK